MVYLRFLVFIFSLLFALLPTVVKGGYGITNLTINDPDPLFTTWYPQDFLLNRTKLHYMGLDCCWLMQSRYDCFDQSSCQGPLPFTSSRRGCVNDPNCMSPFMPNRHRCWKEYDRWRPELLQISAGIFRQSADEGQNFFKRRVPLGDVNGRLNLLALLFDPTTQLISPTINEFLHPELIRNDVTGQRELTRAQAAEIRRDCIPILTDPARTDTGQQLGFFSIPAKYSKRGARFDASLQILEDLGINFAFGIADIKQVHGTFKDLSCQAGFRCCPALMGTNPDLAACMTEECVVFGLTCSCLQFLIHHLMDEIDEIACELDFDLNNFRTSGLDDMRLGLYARHPFAFNEDKYCYPHYLFTPYVTTVVGLPVATERSNRKLFALPLGNNGHASIGFTAGFSFAFRDTIEVGAEAGMTHFFSRVYNNFPLPTQESQAVIFPFSADVCFEPGNNWDVSLYMYAPRFLDRLSAWAQYIFITHSEDEVGIIRDLRLDDRRLRPERLHELAHSIGRKGFKLPQFDLRKFEAESRFEIQLFNFGLNYELAPCMSVGFLWQAPITGRRIFRSTTVMLSIIGTY